MLTVPPWSRLPLTLRWLKQEYEAHFHPHKQPPIHMPIAYGLVQIQSTTPISNDADVSKNVTEHPVCWICRKVISVLITCSVLFRT